MKIGKYINKYIMLRYKGATNRKQPSRQAAKRDCHLPQAGRHAYVHTWGRTRAWDRVDLVVKESCASGVEHQHRRCTLVLKCNPVDCTVFHGVIEILSGRANKGLRMEIHVIVVEVRGKHAAATTGPNLHRRGRQLRELATADGVAVGPPTKGDAIGAKVTEGTVGDCNIVRGDKCQG